MIGFITEEFTNSKPILYRYYRVISPRYLPDATMISRTWQPKAICRKLLSDDLTPATTVFESVVYYYELLIIIIIIIITIIIRRRRWRNLGILQNAENY